MDALKWRRNRRWILAYCGAIVAVVALLGGTRVTAISTSKPAKAQETTGEKKRRIEGTVTLFDDSVVHTIAITYAQSDFDAMIQTFGSTGNKDYIKASITIDGTTVDQVGIRLKGNSTLMSLRRTTGGVGGQQAGGGALGGSASADQPNKLPWLVKFDEFIENQTYQGFDQIAVRPVAGSTSPNALLHETLALRLIGLAGEPTERGAYSSFTVNGGAPVLRLIIEQPGTRLVENEFDDANGALFKALAGGGGFQFVGEDPLAYTNSFRQITGKKQYDYQPLINLIRFATQSTDAEFSSGLESHLDTASFARYIALQNLLLNFDDMAGPGSNYFLFYNGDTKKFSVVSWDMNFALSGQANQGPNSTASGPGGQVQVPGQGGQVRVPGQGGQVVPGQLPGQGGQVPGQLPGQGPQTQVPGQLPAQGGQVQVPAPGGQVGGGGGAVGLRGGNRLKERFLADEKFKALYLAEYWKLYDMLFANGTAVKELARLEGVLTTDAAKLIEPSTVTSEAARVRTILENRTKALATQR